MPCCLGWGQTGLSQPAQASRATHMAPDALCLWLTATVGQ